MKKLFKRFCHLPMSTPDQIIMEILGDYEQTMRTQKDTINLKIDCHNEGTKPDEHFLLNIDSGKRGLKLLYTPKNITTLITLIYGTKCRKHNCFSTGKHLREEHQIQRIDTTQLLRDLQNNEKKEATKRSIRSKIRLLRKNLY